VERARPGSPQRKATLTRAIRSSYAAINRDDYELMRASFHPDAELYPPGRGRAALGFKEVYRGPEEAISFVKQWKSGFSRFRYEPREIADAPGSAFAVRVALIGAMRGSETEVEEEYGVVFVLRGGQVFRQINYYGWPEALDALRQGRTEP
jgi:ketosteroid isomerase-like protein